MPAMNARIDAPASSPASLDAHAEAFREYGRSYYTGEAGHDFHLDLKAEHSRNVFGHASALSVAEESFAASPVRCRALLLAALYHDLGRFRQYHAYGTFSDKLSVNHAHLAVRELKRLGLLDAEDARIRSLALAGIALHNRFALPRSLDPDARMVTEAVRDADKLDIMRVMAGHLTAGTPVDPVIALNVVASREVTPAILRSVMARKLGLYTDMRTTTDFKLLVCGWLYDLNYAWSRKKAVRQGHLAALFASLPQTGDLLPFLAQYEKDMAEYAAS